MTAQRAPALPFAIGERLTYETRAGRVLGGRAEMWIEGPEDIAGTSTMVFRFSFSTKLGPLKVSDETTSWWNPVTMATRRFAKSERHLGNRHEERVDIDPRTGRWRDESGREGQSPTAAPLDELSFIYLIRTLEPTPDSTLRLVRHYDPDRNPTIVRFLGRDMVTVPAGTFETREVEMRVRDARHYRGEGVIRFSLSDDRCSRPVRIVSDVPGAGHVVMTLASATPVIASCRPASTTPR